MQSQFLTEHLYGSRTNNFEANFSFHWTMKRWKKLLTLTKQIEWNLWFEIFDCPIIFNLQWAMGNMPLNFNIMSLFSEKKKWSYSFTSNCYTFFIWSKHKKNRAAHWLLPMAKNSTTTTTTIEFSFLLISIMKKIANFNFHSINFRCIVINHRRWWLLNFLSTEWLQNAKTIFHFAKAWITIFKFHKRINIYSATL